ncbi:MAG: T9SS type A sorting domain-containing protein [Bacteroidetes bacterium]|nr:MAG: T9SS type A sorting domain-containing protein [Bacteroidota bacterium]
MRFTFVFAFLLPLCVLSQNTLLQEDFESGIPVSYSIIDNDGLNVASAVSEFTAAWIPYEEPGNPTNHCAASTSFFDPVGVSDRWLILPQLSLGAFGNSISWEARSHDPSFPDSYLVMVSTTDDQLASFTDTIGYIQEEYDSWTFRSVDLSTEGYDGQNIYVAFINHTYDGFKLYLDNITVVADDPAGIDDLVINVSVYPNPTADFISVKSEYTIELNEIIDLKGNILIQEKESKLNLSHLTPGIYFLRSSAQGRSSLTRIVKY